MRIEQIKALKILNSRAQATIAIKVNGSWCSAPSGASKGKYEVTAFPNGVDFSVEYVNKNFEKLLKNSYFSNFEDLAEIEKKLDVKKVGGNTIIALEYALLSALAKEENKPLWQVLNPKAKSFPLILSNVLGGGAHGALGRGLDIQEILVCAKTKKFADCAFINAALHQELKKDLLKKDKNFVGGKTDEGAWTTSLTDLEALELVNKVRAELEKKHRAKIWLGVDLAASQLYRDRKYTWHNYSKRKKRLVLSAGEQKKLVLDLIQKFDLKYVEDPLQEEDFSGFSQLTGKVGRKVAVCGDDLTVTNFERLKTAIESGSINAIIIKPNQIGSLVQTKAVVDLAEKNGIIPVISHRSGSTCDTTLVHLAKAWQAPFIKIGIAGGERTTKINELIKIEGS